MDITQLLQALPVHMQQRAESMLRKSHRRGWRDFRFLCQWEEGLPALHYLDLVGVDPEGTLNFLPHHTVISEQDEPG